MPKDKKLVLFAGEYWRPEKRFDLVQEAVWRLQQEDRAVELVTLSGKTHNEVPTYMNACDVLALASDGEGSPMVVKEAMACRLPVVSVPVGDVPQVIGGTEGCYLCAQEPEDIAAKLKLALAGHSRTRPWEAAQQFSLEGVARRVVNVYEEALAKHSISRLVESSGRRP
ncbi:MAG: glycosyltransferase [Dehalococcoidia bacterium]